jgi:hypothetical protein
VQDEAVQGELVQDEAVQDLRLFSALPQLSVETQVSLPFWEQVSLRVWEPVLLRAFSQQAV